MKLWLVKQSGRVGWDQTEGFVIRAKSEAAARKIASENAYGSERATWLDAAYSSCVEVKPTGEAEIILEAYKAG